MSEIHTLLASALGDELAGDIIQHRKGLKCPLTLGGAKGLLREYNRTGNPIEAAQEHLNRGWQGFKAEWITKPSRFQDQRNPTPFQQRHQSAMDAFDRKLGIHDEQSPSVIDIGQRDIRPH